jgi:hypothetical protein
MGGAYLASNATAPPGRGDDPADRRERCDEFRDAPPNVIELRQHEVSGPIEWRDLHVDYSGHDPAWSTDSAALNGGWRSAEDLLRTSFAPPLLPSFNSKGSLYIGYAPAEPQTSLEDDQLTNMTAEFGAGTGNFRSSGRLYQYSVAGQLPCFPAPATTK